MSRRRMIDPSIWEDEDFSTLSDKAKILFIACISNADDDGRLSANPYHIKAIAFRFEDTKPAEIEKLIIEVSDKLKNFVHYEADGKKCIQLSKWEVYQKQREDRRKPSKLPTCQTYVRQMPDKCPPKSSQDSLSEDKISQSKSGQGEVSKTGTDSFNKKDCTTKLTESLVSTGLFPDVDTESLVQHFCRRIDAIGYCNDDMRECQKHLVSILGKVKRTDTKIKNRYAYVKKAIDNYINDN